MEDDDDSDGQGEDLGEGNVGAGAAGSPQEQTGKNEFEKLIHAYTAPMPNQKVILSDFEAKDRQKKNRERDRRVLQHEVVQDQIEDDVSEEYSQLQSYMIREFTIHILQSIHFLQNMEQIDDEEILSRQVTLDLKKRHQGIDKLLLFDLDETLAHCVRTENPEQEPDVQLQIRLQSGSKFRASFNIRPYTHQMLREVNKYYEVAVFTASHKWYADEILNYIDPTGELIQHRFYRESCIKTEDNVYLKDLRIIKNV